MEGASADSSNRAGDQAGSGPPLIDPQRALLDMLGVATAISGASDLASLLQSILTTSRQLTASDAGSIYLIDESSGATTPSLLFAAFQNSSLEQQLAFGEDREEEDDLRQLRYPITPERLVGWCVLSGELLNIPDAYAIAPDCPYRFDESFDRRFDYRAVSVLVVPLRTTEGTVVGVMQLINRKHDPGARITPATAADLVRPFDRFDQQLIEALASLAAVCVERTRLLEGQQKQIDSMISLLAGAIDAKSPHTGRHCSRVPELALMLAEAAEACESGPLGEFHFTDEKDWREFRAAAWLHDCGKISTPEAVVDKATKLETAYNRIHEIRTRFEVLLRDARIAQLEAQLAGGDGQQLQQEYERRAQQLQEDFRFVAACNLGSEGMDPEALERLRQLAGVTWWRHFDDRLGLGWEEASRCTEPVAALPAPEPLLADKPRHRIPRPPEELPDSSWQFTMQAPELLYNQGEIHNLSILRGTLTPEELYKIREHMIHTIVMLESISFPPAMSRVAAIAGSHHETLTGSGYPRGLAAEQLSVPARILAIADIFEALTASDRPYKLGKTLSEAVGILAGFRDRSHIDPHLFDLFLRSGVYLSYAQRFLPAHQIDPVDIHQHLR